MSGIEIGFGIPSSVTPHHRKKELVGWEVGGGDEFQVPNKSPRKKSGKGQNFELALWWPSVVAASVPHKSKSGRVEIQFPSWLAIRPPWNLVWIIPLIFGGRSDKSCAKKWRYRKKLPKFKEFSNSTFWSLMAFACTVPIWSKNLCPPASCTCYTPFAPNFAGGDNKFPGNGGQIPKRREERMEFRKTRMEDASRDWFTALFAAFSCFPRLKIGKQEQIEIELISQGCHPIFFLKKTFLFYIFSFFEGRQYSHFDVL